MYTALWRNFFCEKGWRTQLFVWSSLQSILREAFSISCLLLLVLSSNTALGASAGDLDTTFNSTGYVMYTGGSYDNDPYAIAFQSDGKILIGGDISESSSVGNFGVLRYSSSGELDTSGFNASSGYVRREFYSGGRGTARAVLLQDSKILAVGYASTAATKHYFALARYNADGSADTTFGESSGYTLTALSSAGTSNSLAYAAAILKDGRILAAGYAGDSTYSFGLARYSANGVKDKAKIQTVGSSISYATSVAVQSDGKIVVAGYAYNASSKLVMALARFNNDDDLTLDSSFGSSGTGIVLTLVGSYGCRANAITIQSDDAIVVGGQIQVGETGGFMSTPLYDFLVARFTKDGVLDTTSFNSPNGYATKNFGSTTTSSLVNSIALQSDGKIVAAGQNAGYLALARFTSAGVLDTNFGSSGAVSMRVGSLWDVINSVAVQSDGKIVVAAQSQNSSYYYKIAVARFIGASSPTVTTASASSITSSTASSGGNVTSDGGGGVTARGVCWNTSGTPTTSDTCTSDGTGTGAFTSSISGLNSSTTYYVRAFATNPAGTAYGSEISFTTTGVPPTVTTATPSSVTSNSAAGGGNVTSAGSASVTARGVCWSTSSNPTTSDSKTTDGNGTGAFTSDITGLSPSTTYYVRAYATSTEGTAYGSELSFTTTSAIVAPTVTTTTPSSVTSNSASGGGNVTSEGSASVTARGVCWSTSSNPTISDSKTTDGSGSGAFTSAITGLSPTTTYYVRAYATSTAGTSYGSELSFATSGVLPTVTTTPPSSITSTSATSGGNVTSAGSASVTTRGVCWNTTGSPTTSDSCTNDGSGAGVFVSSITGLTISTTYYVRAYATSSVGTAYGAEESFIAITANPAVPALDTAGLAVFSLLLLVVGLARYGRKELKG